MKNRKKLFITGIVFGGFLTLSPVWGLLGTVLGMMRTFHDLGENGVADPKALSNHVGTVLMSSAVGFVLFPVGLAILITFIVLYVKTSKSTPPSFPQNSTQT